MTSVTILPAFTVQTAAMRTGDFIQTIGVNTHLDYWSTSYGNSSGTAGDPQKALTAIQYLGIDQVRDMIPAWNPNNLSVSGFADFALLAQNGIHFDVITYGDTPMLYQQPELDALAGIAPGAVTAIEGANEVNGWPFSFNGLTGAAAVLAEQAALYNALNNDPHLANIPIYNFTTAGETSAITAAYGNVSSTTDYGNFHSYQGFGAPTDHLAADLATAQAETPGAPMVLTEAGYYTQPTAGVWGSVSEDVQAKYTLDLLFDAAKLGIKQTYLYELLDNWSDAGNYSLENHLGLFNADGTPKLAATAIHNMTSILADTGTAHTTFTPASLGVTVSGLPSDGNTMLLQKSDGTYELVIWAEPEIWSHQTLTETPGTAMPVTVNLGNTYAHVETFDPLTGATATSSLTNVSHLTISVTDHPIIIQIDPGLVTAPSSSTTTSSGTSTTSSAPTSSSTTTSSAHTSSTSSTHSTTSATTSTSTPSVSASQTSPPAVSAPALTAASTSATVPAIAQQAAAAGGMLQTAAGTEFVSPSSIGGQIDLLYVATLGHAPDAIGLGYWITQMNAGGSLVTVAQSLIGSPEYQAAHGGDSNGTFVSGLYNSLLGRAADGAGLGYWTSVLDSGTETRAQLAAGFASTSEIMQIQSQQGASSNLANGIFAIDPAALTVASVYQTILGRTADAAGLAAWTQAMHAGLSESDLMNTFVGTPEFQASTGAASSAAFVTTVENNAYGGADAGGVAYWAGMLDSGGVSRAGVAAAYVDSAAMHARVAPQITPH